MDRGTDLLQVQQQSLELVDNSKHRQSLLSVPWKMQAWFTSLDPSHSSLHGPDLLLHHLKHTFRWNINNDDDNAANGRK